MPGAREKTQDTEEVSLLLSHNLCVHVRMRCPSYRMCPGERSQRFLVIVWCSGP